MEFDIISQTSLPVVFSLPKSEAALALATIGNGSVPRLVMHPTGIAIVKICLRKIRGVY